MFPVPSHLPRTGGESLSSPELINNPPAPPDPVLDLLGPLLSGPDGAGPSRWTAAKVRDVRQKLEAAVQEKKARVHEVLLKNYPSVTSHIRLGQDVKVDYARIDAALRGLEAQLNPSDSKTSFLPPVLAAATRHFAAIQRRSRARAHLSALKTLSAWTERLEKLEEAVWAGRGADERVIAELEEVRGYEVDAADEPVRDTRLMRSIQDRMKLLRSMVAEQVTDAYAKAVAFAPSSSGRGTTLAVQNRTTLQQPRIPRPERAGSPARPSKPPPYSLSHLYTTLQRLGALPSLLHALQTHLLRDIVRPLVEGQKRWNLGVSKSDNLSILRLESCDPRTATEILHDIADLLDFISDAVFPAPATALPERAVFLSDIRYATFSEVLEHVILPTMPVPLASIQPWLELLSQAVSCEASPDTAKSVIKPFYDTEAGSAWAKQRRRRVAEEVRRLVLGGWGGWEAVEVEKEREVVVVVEVEVDKPVEEKRKEDHESFGWGFEEEEPVAGPSAPGPSDHQDDAQMDLGEGDGWGFEGAAPAEGPAEGPADPRTNGDHEEPAAEGDGWDFDMDAAPPSKPAPVVKPAREAKKLGKKLAKAKAAEEDGLGPDSASRGSFAATSESNQPENGNAAGDSWGWDEPAAAAVVEPEPAAKEVPPVRARRKVLKEEKRIVRENLLVSRACGKLLDIAERVMKEAQELQTASPASEIIASSLSDVFDIYRALLPVAFASQLRDVPTLAMQLANDCAHLADRVDAMIDVYRHVVWDGSDVSRRLRGAGDAAFEAQLEVQREGVMTILDEARGFVETGTDAGFRRCEKAVKQVEHNVESLARVLEPVLPMPTYLSVLGYVVDISVHRISSEVLALQDITEVESNRLAELLQLLHSLERLFVPNEREGEGHRSSLAVTTDPASPPASQSLIVAQVPHWLKFCYLSELLVANLVDITYLFENGALVDFGKDELVNVVRALFAASEKRDRAIGRIERGLEGEVAAEGAEWVC